MLQEIIGEYQVQFEPRGALADLDYTDAIDALNKAQEAQNVEWLGEGKRPTKAQYGLVDVIYGSLDKSSEYADFLVTKMDHDKTMLISVFNTPGGEQLRKMLDADTTGGLFRFAADITELVDIKVGFWTKVKCQLMRRPYPVSKKAAAFSRFYVVVEKQVQVSAPLTSSLIILP